MNLLNGYGKFRKVGILNLRDDGDTTTHLARWLGRLGENLVLGAFTVERTLVGIRRPVGWLPKVFGVAMFVGLEVVLANPAPRP